MTSGKPLPFPGLDWFSPVCNQELNEQGGLPEPFQLSRSVSTEVLSHGESPYSRRQTPTEARQAVEKSAIATSSSPCVQNNWLWREEVLAHCSGPLPTWHQWEDFPLYTLKGRSKNTSQKSSLTLPPVAPFHPKVPDATLLQASIWQLSGGGLDCLLLTSHILSWLHTLGPPRPSHPPLTPRTQCILLAEALPVCLTITHAPPDGIRS